MTGTMNLHTKGEGKLSEASDRQANITSRLKPIINQLQQKEFRDSYMASHVRRFLAAQMRNLRGEKSQKEFAKILGTTQSVISERYENPEYGQVTLQTLLDIASKLDIALVIRFATFKDFFFITSDFSDDVQEPKPFSRGSIEELMDSSSSVGVQPSKIAVSENHYNSDKPSKLLNNHSSNRPQHTLNPVPKAKENETTKHHWQ
jgi:hypothetical protein